MFKHSRVLAFVCAGSIAVAGAAFGAASFRTSGSAGTSAPAAVRANAGRFLALTSGRTDAAALDSSSAPAISGDYEPNGWKIRPVGKQINTLNFPLGLAATPGGTQVFVSADSGGLQGITQIDSSSLSATNLPAGNLFMGISVTKDGKVYVSGGNANRVFRYRLNDGKLAPRDITEAEPFPIHHALDATIGAAAPQADPLPATDGISVQGYPGNSVIDGRYLYVAGTLSEATGTGTATCPDGQAACARISVIDTTDDTVVNRIPVGLDAYGLAVDAQRHRLYATNWADEAGRGNGTGGTVSIVDITNPLTAKEIGTVPVGHHPSALQLSSDRSRLFVANTNDDSISVIDLTGTPQVINTESVRPFDGVPVGAHPDALALSPDGNTLFVALAGMNAVEILDGHTAARVAGSPMYIPTGWYPSALLVTGTAQRYRLWVANAKGAGAADEGTGYNLSIGQEGIPFNAGTVSVVTLPVAADVANEWTDRVKDNDQLDRLNVDPCAPAGITVSEVLCPPAGQTSPVKHVVYIVTENKTFDQYFGDLTEKGIDADPKYVLYGNTSTPNHHALADRFSLDDRFFSDAQVSVTGHSWTSGAIATDHNEKTWPADYDQGVRGTHGNNDPLKPGIGGSPGGEIQKAEDELQDPEGGYIFEAFKRAGAVPPDQAGPGKLSMAIYGEHTAAESGNMDAYKAVNWKDGDIQYFDTCRADQFVTGSSPSGAFSSAPDQFTDCQGRTLPPQFNLAHWEDVYKKTGQDVMPNFIYMSLPDNHTLGTNLGSPTPASMVADNDHAIGMIVDALSKSPFWESTVLMQTEDDTQAAGDHISPLRDYLEVSGPWAKPGPNHQWGSMPSLLRTIELLFKVPPITLLDRLAYPQHGAFRTSLSDKPDTRPYNVIDPLIPYAVNAPGAPGQALSMQMDFSQVDLINEQLLNAIEYADVRGTPFVWPPKN